MSYRLETRNRGPTLEFGFWGPDTNRIMLGDLPSMTTPQFCLYATETIVEVLNGEDSPQKEEMRETVQKILEYTIEANMDKKVRSTKSPLDLPRHQTIKVTNRQEVSEGISVSQTSSPSGFWREFDEALSENDQEKIDQLFEEYLLAINLSQAELKNYPENPFRVKGDSIVIGEMYVVDLREFAHFAIRYIGGGLYGWNSRGIPDYALESLEALKKVSY